MRTRWLAIIVAVALLGAVGTWKVRATVEPLTGATPAPSWSDWLALVDDALAEGDMQRAGREWRLAYSAALNSRSWEALLAVGDAAVRIAARSGSPTAYRAEARRAYLDALFRARAGRAAASVLRVSQAFARLGDREVAQQARRMAEEL